VLIDRLIAVSAAAAQRWMKIFFFIGGHPRDMNTLDSRIPEGAMTIPCEWLHA
jgi:hypothetical protein